MKKSLKILLVICALALAVGVAALVALPEKPFAEVCSMEDWQPILSVSHYPQNGAGPVRLDDGGLDLANLQQTLASVPVRKVAASTQRPSPCLQVIVQTGEEGACFLSFGAAGRIIVTRHNSETVQSTYWQTTQTELYQTLMELAAGPSIQAEDSSEVPAGPWPALVGRYCPTPAGHHTLVLDSYQYSGRTMEYNKIVYLVGFAEAELADQVQQGDKIGIHGPIVRRDGVVEAKIVESIELYPEEDAVELPQEVFEKIEQYDKTYASLGLEPGEELPLGENAVTFQGRTYEPAQEAADPKAYKGKYLGQVDDSPREDLIGAEIHYYGDYSHALYILVQDERQPDPWVLYQAVTPTG